MNLNRNLFDKINIYIDIATLMDEFDDFFCLIEYPDAYITYFLNTKPPYSHGQRRPTQSIAQITY